jgi:asparagine synthetase B (glutamine-hydrolysing)
MVEATPGEMLSMLSHRGPDGNGVWLEKSAGVGLGQCLRVTTPEALHERQPLVSREGRIALVADARVDNRTDLIQALDLRGDPDKIPDSALILAAYERWGEDCADRIVGDFAFAIWDGNERKWFCARDPFGCRSVHYTHRPGQLFACATEIKALLAVAEIPRELEEMRVGLFLTGTFDDQAITFYKGIFRLPAGHCMVVDESGLRVRRYFELDPKRDIRFRTDDAYAEAFLEIFTEAVRCRLRATAPVLSTLSGGLDSTSIACVASRRRGQRSAAAPPASLRPWDRRRGEDRELGGGARQSVRDTQLVRCTIWRRVLPGAEPGRTLPPLHRCRGRGALAAVAATEDRVRVRGARSRNRGGCHRGPGTLIGRYFGSDSKAARRGRRRVRSCRRSNRG